MLKLFLRILIIPLYRHILKCKIYGYETFNPIVTKNIEIFLSVNNYEKLKAVTNNHTYRYLNSLMISFLTNNDTINVKSSVERVLLFVILKVHVND